MIIYLRAIVATSYARRLNDREAPMNDLDRERWIREGEAMLKLVDELRRG